MLKAVEDKFLKANKTLKNDPLDCCGGLDYSNIGDYLTRYI